MLTDNKLSNTTTNPDSKPDQKNDLKSIPLPELEKELSSTPDGLTQAEARKRLDQYGPNEIEEKKTNLFLKFLSYFWGPIPMMIEAAVLLSAVAKHWTDFFIILVLLFANAVAGFWEEHRAGNEIAALKAKLAMRLLKVRYVRKYKQTSEPDCNDVKARSSKEVKCSGSLVNIGTIISYD